jgi:uncharacterized caspase-like protein
MKFLIIVLSVLTLSSCFKSTHPKSMMPRHMDDLQIVDCLLPGQIRKLGMKMVYVARRRSARLSGYECSLRGGEYVLADRATLQASLKVWLKSANSGDLQAQEYVGEIYERYVHYDSALYWYNKAADRGSKRALVNLGHMLERGLGTEKQPVKALQLYRQAAGLSDRIDYESSIKETADRYKQATSESKELVASLNKDLAIKRENIAKLESQIQGLEKKLNAQIKASKVKHKSAPKASALERKELNDLKTKIVESQGLLKTSNAQIASLQSKITELESLEPAPEIEIIDPTLVVTRSKPFARLRSIVPTQQISGLVKSKIGVKKLTVNGSEIAVVRGVFKTEVAIDAQTVNVTVVAIDNVGQSSQVQFSILTLDDSKHVVAEQVDFTPGGDYHALIIGNNNYDKMVDLVSAINDVKAVDQVLTESYGFKTQVLINANRYQILTALDDYRAKLKADDKLIVYYAGHGNIDEGTQRGYWLPVDSDISKKANWISNREISEVISLFKAKQIMVVADSCYSGTMTTNSLPRPSFDMQPSERKEWLELISEIQSRTVLTSGGVQPVLDIGAGDHSVFADAFLSALRLNKESSLEGYSLYRKIVDKVKHDAGVLDLEQIPQYSPIAHTGHESGEFILVRKQASSQ